MDDNPQESRQTQPVNQQQGTQTSPQGDQQVRKIEEPQSASIHVEHAPVPNEKRPERPQDFVKETAGEVPISKELEGIIERTPDVERPVVPPEAQQAGLTVSQVAAPLPVKPTGEVKIPMTYEEALVIKKQSKIGDAIKWFANLVMYQWKKLYPERYK